MLPSPSLIPLSPLGRREGCGPMAWSTYPNSRAFCCQSVLPRCRNSIRLEKSRSEGHMEQRRLRRESKSPCGEIDSWATPRDSDPTASEQRGSHSDDYDEMGYYQLCSTPSFLTVSKWHWTIFKPFWSLEVLAIEGHLVGFGLIPQNLTALLKYG